MTKRYRDADELARTLIERTDGKIRMALPLGLGKANTIANAITRAAMRDSAISLRIVTALTLESPAAKGDMAQRFLDPARERLFGAYPSLLYAEALHRGDLPENIEVNEFFLLAGRWLGNAQVQRNYISANYTKALDYIIAMRPNVVAQLLAVDGEGRYSLSCNTDLTSDLLRKAEEQGERPIFAGQCNSQLPFMPGSAEWPAGDIDFLLDDPETDFELFSAVNQPVSLADQAIGMHVSRRIADGGTLQIGIGSIGDGVASALLLRDRDNEAYARVLAGNPFGPLGPVGPFEPEGGKPPPPFAEGLYVVSEMLVEGLLQLFEAGIVRREVDGAAIHGGFIVGSRDFYRRLREMPSEQLAKIAMMPVSFTNQLLGGESERRAARRDARFVNNAMKATLMGDIVADSDSRGRVVSGIGGQFDFVSQAHELDGAMSLITVNATRTRGGETESNIVWSHPHISVPRHMRDVIVTEYGIADLRGRTDRECIEAMIAIADSRFQEELAEHARGAGKLAMDWRVPAQHRNNTPENLNAWLAPFRQDGSLPEFPFGTDFTAVEQRLLPGLSALRNAAGSKMAMARLLWRGLTAGTAGKETADCLERMGLSEPNGPAERLKALALRGALLAD